MDITLSDGMFIPKGTLVAAAAAPVHRNESVYANPDVFDPFRFAKVRNDDDEAPKHQVVNTSYDFLPFGHGKHAWCVLPARCAERILIAHIPWPRTLLRGERAEGHPRAHHSELRHEAWGRRQAAEGLSPRV